MRMTRGALVCLLIPLPSFSGAGEGESAFPFVSLGTKGFLTAKADPNAEAWMDSQKGLNHHGALYADVVPEIHLSDEAAFRIRLNLMNPSFSGERVATANWYALGSLERRFGPRPDAGAGDFWRLEAGNLDDQTVGAGLTFKDFRTLGLAGRLVWNGLDLKAISWAQDYDTPGDVFLAGIGSIPLHAGANFILWFDEGGSERPSFYALPWMERTFGSFTLYGECGLKIPGDEMDAREAGGSYPERSWAALLGVRFRKEGRAGKADINSEIRYYGRNFIPLTLADEDVYTGLHNYGKTTNNWVDFFPSVSSSRWFYLQASAESPAWKGLSAFCANELLLFLSPQESFWDRRSSGLVALNPSSDYYRAGARYSARGGIKLDLMLTNRLLNIDPWINRDPRNDIPLLQYGPHVMRQYRSRFYPSRSPILELRAWWGFDAL